MNKSRDLMTEARDKMAEEPSLMTGKRNLMAETNVKLIFYLPTKLVHW